MEMFGEAVEMGRANAKAIDLTRRHCRHARIEFVGGNSPVGSTLGLPMGLLEIRCIHAPPPRTQGHQALELAIEFYEANCRTCSYREGTGELPNLATVAAERSVAEAAREAAAQRAAEDRAQRHRERRLQRHQLLAGEGHVVWELGEAIDRIDRAEPRVGPPTADEERAARHVLDAARGASELFRPVLVESLLDLAEDTADATAFRALEVLVGSGRCQPRRALMTARAVLARQRSIDAAQLLALLEPELRPDDLPEILHQLIALTSGEGYGPWRQPTSSVALVAASHVDLSAVTSRIIEHLASNDERTREAGAEAARVLVALDSTRIVALGSPLAASVRGPERGYAGDPHPTSAALRALAEGWRGQPELARQIVEDQAAGASETVKAALSRVPWFLKRFHDPWDASAAATSEAVNFLVRRAAGDWGEDAADHAAEHLRSLGGEVPAAIAAHVTEILGVVLALCSPDRDVPSFMVQADVNPSQAALGRRSLQIGRDGRRRRLAETVGGCASVDPEGVISAVRDLFSATTNDDRHDRAVRTTMLNVLKNAVSPRTLRAILPTTYTAVLDPDHVVRSTGIDLWVACAGAADSLPAELTELSVPLLEDRYKVVHCRMLDRIPLHLPAEVAPTLLPIVYGWLLTYAKATEQDVVESAIWALLSLAHDLDNEEQVTAWCRVALAYVHLCRPRDRERLLTSAWLNRLRNDLSWIRAALATAASIELVDYHNQRDEPVLKMLMDEPRLLADIPIADIEPLSSMHSAAHTWRALEPVELLQAAGRWSDAATIALAVEARQSEGAEGAPGRRLAGTFARAARLAQALAQGPPDVAEVATLSEAVIAAVANLEATIPGGVQDREFRSTLDCLIASAKAARVLLARTVSDPTTAAAELDDCATHLTRASSTHASGSQRAWIGRAWQIAAVLLRYDAAVRGVAAEATALLQAAKRQAQVLSTELSSAVDAAFPDGIAEFLTAVEDLGDPEMAQVAWQRLGRVPAPVSLIGSSLLFYQPSGERRQPEPDEPPRAVCVATMQGVPVTDTLVLRRGELYHLGMTVRLLSTPEWAKTCVVEPISTIPRDALTLPRYEFSLSDGNIDDFGVTLADEQPLHCALQQPIRAPDLDCPIHVRLVGDGKDRVIDVAGLKRLRVRPFDPSRDVLTEHEQTDARLLQMVSALDSPNFDTEDVRAFSRLFAACVRAAQVIMFDRTFRKGSRVSEKEFHDELERRLRDDPMIEGRLTRRDAVAGGFDDLLHDDVIAELKVSRGAAITVGDCAHYLGQPAQYGAGRGSQLSVLVVFDHGRKQAPPGVIENYIGWLKPRLHGLDNPRYPSLVGVLIVNTNLPVPSAWSRHRST